MPRRCSCPAAGCPAAGCPPLVAPPPVGEEEKGQREETPCYRVRCRNVHRRHGRLRFGRLRVGHHRFGHHRFGRRRSPHRLLPRAGQRRQLRSHRHRPPSPDHPRACHREPWPAPTGEVAHHLQQKAPGADQPRPFPRADADTPRAAPLLHAPGLLHRDGQGPAPRKRAPPSLADVQALARLGGPAGRAVADLLTAGCRAALCTRCRHGPYVGLVNDRDVRGLA